MSSQQWLRMLAQADSGHPKKALRTCEQILSHDAQDPLALESKAQILTALERFHTVLQVPSVPPLQLSYSLYKLTAYDRALEPFEDGRLESSDAQEEKTASKALLAQIKYRQHDFQTCVDLYNDLIADTHEDSPEYADLQNNLQAAQQYLEFIKEIPSKLSDHVSSITSLESRPVTDIIASYRPQQSTTAPKTVTIDAETKQVKRRRRTTKLPPSIATLEPEKRPAPNPERWLPKRERTAIPSNNNVSAKRAKELKKKEAAWTQGAAVPSSTGQTQPQTTQNLSSSNSTSKKKKKKGGR